jgi:hypothetical protein
MTDSELQEKANTVISGKEVSVCRESKQLSCEIDHISLRVVIWNTLYSAVVTGKLAVMFVC